MGVGGGEGVCIAVAECTPDVTITTIMVRGTPDCRQQTADSRQETADSKQQTADKG
jgi:hypothetical protein